MSRARGGRASRQRRPGNRLDSRANGLHSAWRGGCTVVARCRARAPHCSHVPSSCRQPAAARSWAAAGEAAVTRRRATRAGAAATAAQEPAETPAAGSTRRRSRRSCRRRSIGCKARRPGGRRAARLPSRSSTCRPGRAPRRAAASSTSRPARPRPGGWRPPSTRSASPP